MKKFQRRNWYLRFSFEKDKKLTDKKIIIAVDLGVTTSATCCAMLADGTVIGRKFINHPIEKDQQKHMLNRINHISAQCSFLLQESHRFITWGCLLEEMI